MIIYLCSVILGLYGFAVVYVSVGGNILSQYLIQLNSVFVGNFSRPVGFLFRT